jgi:DNA-binding NtrC family response regulator
VKNILVIEQDQAFINLLIETTSNSNRTFHSATSIAEIENTILKHPIDICILGIQTYTMHKVCKILQSKSPNTILLLSTSTILSESHQEEMKKIGVKGYIFKPVSPTYLIHLLDTVLLE